MSLPLATLSLRTSRTTNGIILSLRSWQIICPTLPNPATITCPLKSSTSPSEGWSLSTSFDSNMSSSEFPRVASIGVRAIPRATTLPNLAAQRARQDCLGCCFTQQEKGEFPTWGKHESSPYGGHPAQTKERPGKGNDRS